MKVLSPEPMVDMNVQTGMMNLFMNTHSTQVIITIAAIRMAALMVHGVILQILKQNGIYVQSISVRPVLMNSLMPS